MLNSAHNFQIQEGVEKSRGLDELKRNGSATFQQTRSCINAQEKENEEKCSSSKKEVDSWRSNFTRAQDQIQQVDTDTNRIGLALVEVGTSHRVLIIINECPSVLSNNISLKPDHQF